MITSLHDFSCFMMIGIIWIIQAVHYPSFRFIDADKFTDFEKFHSKSITFIVMPLMLVEAITISILFFLAPNFFYGILFTLTLFIWLITFFVSIKCHSKLILKRDDATIDRLINSNWLRTVPWTVKGVMLIYV